MIKDLLLALLAIGISTAIILWTAPPFGGW